MQNVSRTSRAPSCCTGYGRNTIKTAPPANAPWVPSPVIDEMWDIMPSKGLIIHEYRTHGTCSGLDPAQYFGVARELYERVKVPEPVGFRLNKSLSADEIETAFESFESRAEA